MARGSIKVKEWKGHGFGDDVRILQFDYGPDHAIVPTLLTGNEFDLYLKGAEIALESVRKLRKEQ